MINPTDEMSEPVEETSKPTRKKKTPTGNWEKVRIKIKYAEYIREVAKARDESFMDALYRIIEFYWEYQRGNPPTKPVEIKSDIPSQPTTLDDDFEMDFSTFE